MSTIIISGGTTVNGFKLPPGRWRFVGNLGRISSHDAVLAALDPAQHDEYHRAVAQTEQAAAPAGPLLRLWQRLIGGEK